MTAACTASVSALTKVVYAWEEDARCPTPLEFVRRLRYAATAVSQLQAAMGLAISKSDLGISHGLLKESLTEALDKVKSSFAAMLQQCKKILVNLDPNQAEVAEQMIEKPKEAITHLLSCVISLSEVNISEVKNVACKPLATDVEAAQKMIKSALPDPPAQRPEEESVKEYLDGGNVWDEGPDTEENTSMAEGKLKLASFNKIIEKMTSHDAERDMLLKTFILAHPAVTTAEAFLDKLLQRFEVPSSHSLEKTAFQARVLNALLVWLTNHYEDVPPEIVTEVEDLINSVKTDPALKGWANRMLALIQRKQTEEDAELERQYAVDTGHIDAILNEPSPPLNPSKVLVMYSEEDIAKQITLLDFEVYSKIRCTELLDQAWSKPKYKYRARNIARLIARSNDVTLWACSLIVWPKQLKERIRHLTKVIEIAAILQRLNNFNSLVSMMSALNNSAVHRLKHTFDGLSEESKRVLEELKTATKVDGNRKNYRQALAQVSGPAIPFIGVTLTDITFMDDANSSFVRNLINVSKFEKLHGMVSEVLSFQANTYDIEPNEALQNFLVELPHNSEDELFKLSLLREPRGAEKSAIV